MNLAFVYNKKDAELALESAKAIAACGMNYNHKATVCCEEPTPHFVKIIETLKEAFPVVGRIVAQDGFEGWPLGPNQMFVDCSIYFYSSGELWFFWEPDCVPIKERWLDKLQEDYDKKPAIMGSVNKSGVCRNGKIMYEFINGSAVYPANFLDFCPLARNLHSYNLNYRALRAKPDPWDIYCRWEFLKIGRNTDLIRSYWKTKNYRKVEDKIIFDGEDELASEALALNCPELTVDPQSVVVHGCKDATLHKLIYQKSKPEKHIEQAAQDLVKGGSNKDSEKFLSNLRSLSKTLDKPKKSRKKKPQCNKTK